MGELMKGWEAQEKWERHPPLSFPLHPGHE
jgi:hypothetical protein